MASLRIDDVSPLIQYNSHWTIGSAERDVFLQRYSDSGTMHLSNMVNAEAKIQFNGTGIVVYGAKRPNHDQYTVTLDGVDTVEMGRGDELYQVPLFKATGLANGPHSFVLRNTRKNSDREQIYLDIDFVDILSELPPFSARVEHGDFDYKPEPQWSADVGALGSSTVNAGHVTGTLGASATLTFTGTAVDLSLLIANGVVCPWCGRFNVTLDGEPQGSFLAASGQWTKSETLFFTARNLAESRHTIDIVSAGSGLLAIEYAVIYSTERIAESNVHHVNSAGGGSSSPKTALLPVLVGVFGGLVLFLIIVTLILWRYRRRRHHPSQFFSSHPPSTWDTSPPASVRPLAIPPVAYVPRPSISASSEGGTAPVAWFMPSPGTALPPSYFTGPVNNGQRDKYPDCGSSNPLKGISRERRGVI